MLEKINLPTDKILLIFDALLTESPDFIYVLDSNHRFIFANPSLLNLWGKSQEEICGKTFKEIGYPPELYELHRRQFDTVFKTMKSLKGENPFTGPMGETRYYEYLFIPMFDAEGKPEYVFGVTWDITVKKLARDEIKKNRDQLDLAMKTGKIGVFEMDLSDPLIPVMWSDMQYEIFGLDKKNGPLKYEDFRKLIHKDDLAKVDKEFEESIKDNRDFNLTYRIHHPDGSTRWIFGNSQALKDEDGIPQRMIGTNIDVTALKTTEHALIEAIKARDEVLGVVSHDLRNPLNSILMRASMIGKSNSLEPDKVQKNVEAIIQSGRRMNEMIEDLLNFEKIEAGYFTLHRKQVCGCNIANEAYDTMSPLAHDKSIDFILTGAENHSLQIVCDHLQLLRVFNNIIGNAIKFTPPKGHVELKVEDQEDFVHFSVKDSGPGIPEEHLTEVFEPHWQARSVQHMGNGLGLTISKAIIEAHGGKIWVESRPGKGCTFHFVIPKIRGSGL